MSDHYVAVSEEAHIFLGLIAANRHPHSPTGDPAMEALLATESPYLRETALRIFPANVVQLLDIESVNAYSARDVEADADVASNLISGADANEDAGSEDEPDSDSGTDSDIRIPSARYQEPGHDRDAEDLHTREIPANEKCTCWAKEILRLDDKDPRTVELERLKWILQAGKMLPKATLSDNLKLALQYWREPLHCSDNLELCKWNAEGNTVIPKTHSVSNKTKGGRDYT
ncbi:Hypothetical Protein FCC1311_058862 [Hondaea fermentalgiana]|uniref:Uncharacterized protein n=1 Tax=Hondaea fermentalgiana TaxID=2315210 RepID=A0A2R5GGE4_9STRA|nr:Hypothetical Protein FCC1311_058862 [Hondaea fermentalgiana]|eukprot:GBG29665.1 Hypothetical Protein FCC1311_058862 [Hondaea fermentalgiana]